MIVVAQLFYDAMVVTRVAPVALDQTEWLL